MPCQKFRACLENWYGASSLCLLPKKKKKNRAESEIPCVSGELARCQLLVLAASYIQKKKKNRAASETPCVSGELVRCQLLVPAAS